MNEADFDREFNLEDLTDTLEIDTIVVQKSTRQQ